MSAIHGKIGGIFKQYSGTDKSKLLADFQDDESWSSGTGTQSDDSTNYRLGTESIKIAEDDNSAGLLYSDLAGVTLNVEQFADGSASDDDDYIQLIFYVSDADKVTNVFIGFDDDATYDGTTAFTYSITSIVTGWNTVKIKKSAFTQDGLPAWSSIGAVRVGWTSTVSASGEYVSFQAIHLVDDSYEVALLNNVAYTLDFLTLCYNWTHDIQNEVKETTTFLQAGVTDKTFIPGLNSHTTNIESYWNNGDFLDSVGDNLVMLLYTDVDNNYRYEVETILQGDNISSKVNDLVMEKLNFQGTGQGQYSDVQEIDS